MKKFLKTTVIFTFLAFAAKAQNAKEVLTRFNKQERPAFTAEYPISKKMIDNTLKHKLAKAGSGGRRYKGFRMYEAVVLPELSSTKIDFYSKVKGNRSMATVTILVSTGYDNFVSTASNSSISSNVQTMLNQLKDEAVALKAEQDLAAQQLALKKAEEKKKRSDEKAQKLAKKKAELDKKLAEENKTGSKASQQVETEKVRLENLKLQKAE